MLTHKSEENGGSHEITSNGGAKPSASASTQDSDFDVPVKQASSVWLRAKGMMTFGMSAKNVKHEPEDKKAVSVAMLGKLKMRAAEARQTHQKKHAFAIKVIIEPDSTIRVVADLVSVILLVYTIFEIPFTIIFLDAEFCTWDWRVVLNLFADIVFMLEIVMNFNTAYYSEEAMLLVRDHKAIAQRYMRGWFYVDICSSLPLEHIMCGVGADTSSNALLRGIKIMRFLKLARIAKFLRVLRKWEVQSGSRVFGTSVRIIKFVMLMVMSAHLCGCLWMGLIDVAQCQIPMDEELADTAYRCDCVGDNCQPLNWLVSYDEKLAADHSNETSASKYLISLYFTIMTLATVGYGDIAPTNDYERLYAVVLAMIGAMVFAFCIGSISNLATEGNRYEMRLESATRDVADFMHFRGVPSELQIRVRKHLNHTAKRAPHLVHPCLDLLPRSLRNEVIESVSRESVAGIKWFEHMDADFRSQLLALMRPLSLRPKEYLFRALESATEMYIVVRGTLQVWDLDERMVVAKLGEGDVVGEIGLLEDALPYRTASVTARTECELLELQRGDFHRHLKPLYPDAYQAIKELGEVRLKHLFLPDKLRAKFRAVSSTRTGTLREWKEKFLKSRAAVATASVQHAIIGTTTAANHLPNAAAAARAKRGRSVSAFEPAAISITELHASNTPSSRGVPSPQKKTPGTGSAEKQKEDEAPATDTELEPSPRSSLRRRMSLPVNLRDPEAALCPASPAIKTIRKWSLGFMPEDDPASASTGLNGLQQLEKRGAAIRAPRVGRHFAEEDQAEEEAAKAPPHHAVHRQFSERRTLPQRVPVPPPSDSLSDQLQQEVLPLPGQPARSPQMNRTNTADQQRLNAQTGPNLNKSGSDGSMASTSTSSKSLCQANGASSLTGDAIDDGDATYSSSSWPGPRPANRGNLPLPTHLEQLPLQNGTACLGQGQDRDSKLAPALYNANSLTNLKHGPLKPLPHHNPSRGGHHGHPSMQPLPGSGSVDESGWSGAREGSLSPVGKNVLDLNGEAAPRAWGAYQRCGDTERGRERERGGERGGDIAAIGQLLEGMEMRIQAELRGVRETHERHVGELQKQVALLRDEVAAIKGSNPHVTGT